MPEEQKFRVMVLQSYQRGKIQYTQRQTADISRQELINLLDDGCQLLVGGGLDLPAPSEWRLHKEKPLSAFVGS